MIRSLAVDLHPGFPRRQHRFAWAQLHTLELVIDIYTDEDRRLQSHILERSVRFLQRITLPNLKIIRITIQFDKIEACIALMAAKNGPRLCADLEEAIGLVQDPAIIIARDQGIQSARKSLWVPRVESLFPAMRARNLLTIAGPRSASFGSPRPAHALTDLLRVRFRT